MMSTTATTMIWAMAMMVLLTTIIGVITIKVRFSGVKSGTVSVKYFKLMQGDNIPDVVTKTARSFNNQFEMPMLFYVVGTLYVSLGIESVVAMVLAALFVLCRYVHAYVHLTYNNVLHRMRVFAAASICVIALWVNLLVHVAK